MYAVRVSHIDHHASCGDRATLLPRCPPVAARPPDAHRFLVLSVISHLGTAAWHLNARADVLANDRRASIDGGELTAHLLGVAGRPTAVNSIRAAEMRAHQLCHQGESSLGDEPLGVWKRAIGALNWVSTSISGPPSVLKS